MRADAVVQPLAAALAEPTRRVGKRFISLYTLAFLGLWAAFFAPIQVLLAQQMELLAPGNKEAALGWVTGAGALVALFANPLFGAWSDRTTSALGRRRPWTLAGAAVGALALWMLGQQHSVAMMEGVCTRSKNVGSRSSPMEPSRASAAPASTSTATMISSHSGRTAVTVVAASVIRSPHRGAKTWPWPWSRQS